MWLYLVLKFFSWGGLQSFQCEFHVATVLALTTAALPYLLICSMIFTFTFSSTKKDNATRRKFCQHSEFTIFISLTKSFIYKLPVSIYTPKLAKLSENKSFFFPPSRPKIINVNLDVMYVSGLMCTDYYLSDILSSLSRCKVSGGSESSFIFQNLRERFFVSLNCIFNLFLAFHALSDLQIFFHFLRLSFLLPCS